MAVEAVIGLVGADRGDRRGGAGEQALAFAPVGGFAHGQGVSVQRAGPCVDRQVQLAPDPALVLAMDADLPLTLAIDLEPGGVDSKVHGTTGGPRQRRQG
jgi:hypothetical protein